MSDRAAATDHRPLSGTACDRFMGNAVTVTVVTRLGARLAIADPAERAARCPGGARG
jgi:hypothetical protein